MGYMGDEAETPGASLMVLGSDLHKHVGKRVAVMAIIDAVDDEQVNDCWVGNEKNDGNNEWNFG